MNKNSKAIAFGLILAFASTNAIAAKKEKPLPLTPATEFEDVVSIPTAEYNAQIAKAEKRGSRKPSSNGDNLESMLSEPMKNLRKSLLTIKSSEEMEQKISAISAQLDAQDRELSVAIRAKNGDKKLGDPGYIKVPYEKSDRDFRYFASQIVPMRCLRGFTWKFTPIAEKSKFIDSILVSAVFSLAQSMQIMTPQLMDIEDENRRKESSPDGEANISKHVFDYVTKPYDGAVLFAEGFDLQEHMMKSCYMDLQKSAWRLEHMDLTQPIAWDNKMFFGVGTFPNDLDRYKKLGEAERFFSLSMKYAGMHYISFFRAYSVKNYFKMLTDLGRLRVRDAFPEMLRSGFEGIDGVSLKDRAKVIRETPSTFTLLPDGGNLLANKSWPALRNAILNFSYVWAEVKNRPEDQGRVINPAFLNAFGRATDESVKNWVAMTNGPVLLESRLTKRSVLFDLSKFYTTAQVQDLRNFLPRPGAFRTGKDARLPNPYKTYIRNLASTKNETVEVVQSGRIVNNENYSRYKQYRNWYYGGATAWDLTTWQSIFPNLKSSDELPQTLRTMSQAWGGSAMALPLFQFIR